MPLRAPVLAAAAAAVTSAAAQQQNVLYFICDDLRPEFLAAYDQKVMITPAMDKLASEALVFDKAYCSVAVCSPSRNSFMRAVAGRTARWSTTTRAPTSERTGRARTGLPCRSTSRMPGT
jgi:arylsulfatase A-like enzyme